MTMDMSRYLGLFISEATDHLEALGRDLVELEREGSSSAVDSMFRHAHSVKGMASSMGFEPIAIVAHRVEDLVDAVRQDRGRLDRDLVDLLLTAADTMLAQVRSVAEGKPPDDASVLLTQLGQRVTVMTGHAPAATRVAKVTALKSEGGADSGGDAPGGAGSTDGDSGTAATGASSDGTGSAAGGTATGGAGSTSGGMGTATGGSDVGTTGRATDGGAGSTGSSGTGGSGPSDPDGNPGGGPGTSGSGSGTSGGSAPPQGSSGGPGTSGPSGASLASGAHPTSGSTGASLSSHGASSGAGLTLTSAQVSAAPPEGTHGTVVPLHGRRATDADPSQRPSPNDLANSLKAAASAPLPEPLAQRWAVRLRIAPTCQVPGVRAFLVHKRLTNLGTLVDLRPALEELKAGRIPDGNIQLELETPAGEAGIHAALKNVAEVEVVSVKPAVAAPVVPTMVPVPDGGRAPADTASRTVRVRTELLDYFLDTVGELMLATARLREVGKVLPENTRPALEEGVYRLHTLVKDLHDKVMTARMTPLSLITDRLPRAARDIARRKEREVDLVITGAEIELDRAILEELADPLLHLLRNCIDHGLEAPEDRAAAKKGPRGRVLVAVKRARDRVIIELEDDGRGMDPAKLKNAAVSRGLLSPEAAARMTDREAFMLSCLPGVSTAKDITDISGRGVGMDAVKRVVENVGGTLEIDSERGRGTRFTLRLPLTVAVVHLLLVEVGEEVFGLPIAKVVGATEADGESLSRSRETALLPHGNSLLPVHSLDALVGVPAPRKFGTQPFVVMDGDSGRVALAVDRLLGQEEVVLKPLSRPLDLLPGLSGVTILGSGRPVFILDVPRLLTA
ncbi:Signal transduction histidine kinase CheA [Myxococcus hansupus]|uniref:Chemotaxis protein CheA n=1 Tax=Pseudomyxococcus hansupus TaxID=1297742 RepID=A0A0H4WIY3_9BACT|nr:chemotaxis protein CheA [Myxococcus hansupus]AKQ63286.1 Signal transduction histidine kinase CheA [Myxococcus hansupus]